MKRQKSNSKRNRLRRLRYRKDLKHRKRILDYNRNQRQKIHVKEKRAKRERLQVRLARQLLINNLGGQCIICNFQDRRALQLDHKKGNGGKERKRFKSSATLYRYYLSHPILAQRKLQVLCANHNLIKKIVNDEISRKYKVGKLIV